MKLFENKSYDISTALKAKLQGQYHSVICHNSAFSERTLLRAKKGELVKAQTVKAIAMALDCQPEDLLNQNGICWVSARNADLTNPAAITIHPSLSKFVDGLIVAAGIFSQEVQQSDLELTIERDKTVLTVKLVHLNSDIVNCWSVRAAQADEGGLIYINSSESAELQLELEIERLHLSITDNVILNGVKQFSYVQKPGWLVIFHKFKKNQIKSYVGEQHFLSAEDFQATLNEWLIDHDVADVSTIVDSIWISPYQTIPDWNCMVISRANFGPGGEPFAASFNKNFLNELTKQMTSKEKRISCISSSNAGSARALGPCKQSVSMY